MVMGTGIGDLRGMTSGFQYDQLFSTSSSSKSEGQQPLFDENTFIDLPNFPFNPTISGPTSSAPTADATTSSSLTASAEVDSLEDSEIFSDIVLSYISQMLLEEDTDDKFEQFQEHPALLAAEKPFYDILAENYSPPSDHPPISYSNHSSESPDDSVHNHHGSSSSSNSVVVDGSLPYDSVEYQQLQTHPASVDYSSQSSFSSTNSVGNIVEGLDEYLLNALALPDLLTQSQPASEQFKRGVEEARKFLPGEDKLVIDVEAGGFSLPREPRRENNLREVKVEKEEREYLSQGSRGRKNRHSDHDLELEWPSNKQSAVFPEQTVRREMFDMVLLHNEGCARDPRELRAAMEKEASKSSQSNQSRGSGGGKGRGKRQTNKREVVDLRTILVHCAQAVASDDRRNAGELLKQIRQHSSPHGDASQRLAHYFADGIQARLAGTGSQIYNSLVAKPTCVTDILKAYRLYMAACPFKKISYFFSNQTILDAAEKATRVHIVDYGMYYGFQWPCFLQCLSSRPGGPPSLRITGIDLPQPGFRPAERIEETGRRLADYCRSFNIPFEYRAIAAKWEDVRVEDLNIDRDEMTIVNCLYRLKNVMDETVVVDSPRNKVLNTIRKMNPDVFIHGIVNGCYGAPFFVTRFREALFHFSALFDMLETNVPREDAQRLLIERSLFGREALNVISCEGLERVERPETYKQWQVRNLRAGFTQLPLKPDMMKKGRDKVKACYHKDFVVDEDSGWLLQGWKGRIIYALSAWKPNNAS